MQENPLIAVASIYGLDVIAQTLKSINAFEITYNGHLLHSKLKTGQFPRANELIQTLERIRHQELEEAQAKESEEQVL